MRGIYGLLLAAILLAAVPAPACGPSPTTLRAVNAVWTASSGVTEPERPKPEFITLVNVDIDFLHQPALKKVYAGLAADRTPEEWSAAIEALVEARAAGCVATGLFHPDAQVRLRCALALSQVGGYQQGASILAVARANAQRVPPNADPAAQILYIHALAAALNHVSGENVVLKDGLDLKGMRAGLPRWERAISERQVAAIKAAAGM